MTFQKSHVTINEKHATMQSDNNGFAIVGNNYCDSGWLKSTKNSFLSIFTEMNSQKIASCGVVNPFIPIYP